MNFVICITYLLSLSQYNVTRTERTNATYKVAFHNKLPRQIVRDVVPLLLSITRSEFYISLRVRIYSLVTKRLLLFTRSTNCTFVFISFLGSFVFICFHITKIISLDKFNIFFSILTLTGLFLNEESIIIT